MAQPTTRRWIAAIGSFGIYAIPLVGPHAAWFLGESLLQGFGSNLQIGWIATNVAVAVAAQLLVGVVLYWSLGGGWVRKIAWLGVIPLIGWSLSGGSGRHRTNTGRSVTSAAVDPTGRLIAISETTTLSIGHAGDVVYVLRTDTGADVFRIYLPRYTRSQVVFFEGGLFGYSNLEGTRILKVLEAQ